VAQRRAALDRYGADYVVLWRSRLAEYLAAPSMLAQPALFRPVITTHRLVVLRVVR